MHRRDAEGAEDSYFVCRETTTNKTVAIADNYRITSRQDAKGAKFREDIRSGVRLLMY